MEGLALAGSSGGISKDIWLEEMGDPVAAVQAAVISGGYHNLVVQVESGIPFGAMRARSFGSFTVDGDMNAASVTTNKVYEVTVGGNMQNSTVTA